MNNDRTIYQSEIQFADKDRLSLIDIQNVFHAQARLKGKYPDLEVSPASGGQVFLIASGNPAHNEETARVIAETVPGKSYTVTKAEPAL